jgi:hypothetical protein
MCVQLSDRRKEVTDMQVSFLGDILKNGLVLDHCCGPGRISIPLSAYMPVIGLDLRVNGGESSWCPRMSIKEEYLAKHQLFQA